MYTCASSRARSQADAFAAIDDLYQGSRRGHPADQQVRASGRGRPGSPVWAPVSAASEISLSVDALGGPALTTAWIVPQCRSSGYEPCRQPLEATEICAITKPLCVKWFRRSFSSHGTWSSCSGDRAGIVVWIQVREWLGRRAGARGVSRPRWRQSRSPVALPGLSSGLLRQPAGHRLGGGRRWRC
jgi:hypothetical protein